MARIAFIGLGHMGGGMAPNLAKAGHDVRAFDHVAEAGENAKENGCGVAPTAADPVKNADGEVERAGEGGEFRDGTEDSHENDE